jgi:hypothetical protein
MYDDVLTAVRIANEYIHGTTSCTLLVANDDCTQHFIPTRPLGSTYDNDRLPQSTPIVALECSSFSNFCIKQDDDTLHKNNIDVLSIDVLHRDHPMIQSWLDTIEYAIKVAGITTLDTAPWLWSWNIRSCGWVGLGKDIRWSRHYCNTRTTNN